MGISERAGRGFFDGPLELYVREVRVSMCVGCVGYRIAGWRIVVFSVALLGTLSEILWSLFIALLLRLHMEVAVVRI